MVAYAMYWIGEIDKDRFIGMLPERRKKPERITQESVLKWVRTFLDDIADLDLNNIYFVQKELKEEILL
jgi:hypothetical protein